MSVANAARNTIARDLKPLAYAREHWIPKTGQNQLQPISTIESWADRGLKTKDGGHVRLKLVRIGQQRFTTQEAVEEFFSALWNAVDQQA